MSDSVTENQIQQLLTRFRKDSNHGVSKAALPTVPSVGMWSLDVGTVSSSINERFRMEIGIEDSEEVHAFSHLHPDDIEPVLEQLEGLLEGTWPFDIECRFMHKGGAYHWYRLSAHAERAEDGAPLSVLGTLTDVSARREAEQKLRTSEANLREANEALKLEIEERRRAEAALAASEQTLAKRVAQQSAVASLAQLALTDASLADILDQAASMIAKTLQCPISDIFELQPAGRQLNLRAGYGWAPGVVGRVMEPHSIGTQSWFVLRAHGPVQIENLRRDTRFRPSMLLLHQRVVSGIAAPVQGSSQPFGSIGAYDTQPREFDADDVAFLGVVAHVVSAAVSQRQMESMIRTAELRARESDRAKGEFLANMSHEIRTPMNGILGMSELVLESSLTPEQREYMETVTQCGQSLLSLINDILDLSKIEAGKLTIEEIEFDLLDTMDQILSVLSHRISDKSVALLCDIGPDVPTMICGDPVRLGQVLMNLGGNAAKFTESGEVRLIVRLVKSLGAKSRLSFEVRDTGIGIPKDRQQAIFEGFTQAEGATTRHYGGTGLGLTIARRIIDALGGTLSLKSTPGVGSTFRAEIDLTNTQPLSPTYAETLTTYTGIRDKRILIADGQAAERHILEQQLTAAGAQVRCCAPDAIVAEIDDQPQFDLVLADEEAAALLPAKTDPQARIAVLAPSSKNLFDHSDTLVLPTPIRPARSLDSINRFFAPADSSGETSTTEAARANPQQSDPGPETKVLLVEDNPVNIRLAQVLLRRLGCDVTTAENGRLGVEAFAAGSFDLILMDVQMPVMDGFEAARAIREAEEPPKRTPIIAMTAHAMKEDRNRCLDAGMDDHIPKPIRVPQLESALGRWKKNAPHGART